MPTNHRKVFPDLIKQDGFVRRSYLVIALLLLLTGSAGRLAVATEQDPSARELWQDESPTLNLTAAGQETHRILRLDTLALRRLLAGAPDEAFREADNRRVELPLPMPDGLFQRFQMEESTILDGSLAARYPEIKTYSGYSIDDRAVTMRCDLTPQGFHATVILADHSVVSIHPLSQTLQVDGAVSEPIRRYISYQGKIAGEGEVPFTCGVKTPDTETLAQIESLAAVPYQSGGTLRVYRIAIAATWEYANAYGGGTNAGTVSSMTTWLNAVNAIYERELTVRLRMIDAPLLLYTSENRFFETTDPFTNPTNYAQMLNELGPPMTSVGAVNFDVGHLLHFNLGGGGIAEVGVVCGPNKGVGLSAVDGAIGSTRDLSTFAHELGHQFGAWHTFNGTADSGCSPNRDDSSAFEPGSGTTIMSYAGLCPPDNVVTFDNSDLRFHVGSIRQILTFIQNSAGCFSSISTGNSAPVVNGGPDYIIPMRTPFELRATGSDPNSSDVPNLTYTWEQTDAGNSFVNPPYTDSGDPITTTRPIFRSYPPTSSQGRFFPSLTYILNNANVPPDTVSGLRVAESLPMVGRTLNFGVTVRDNRAGGGGIADDSVRLTVAGNAGPFQITSPNTAISVTSGTPLTVEWNVNNTNVAPVNCTQVRIHLSTDNGMTFPTTLSSATPNDGSETVTLPTGVTATQARVRVEAVGNIFFDISDAAFTIAPSPLYVVVAVSPSSVMEDGTNRLAYTLTRNSVNLASTLTVNFSLGGTASASAGGGVAADYTVSGGAVSFNSSSRTGTVSFSANVSSAQVIVSPVADQTPEIANETVILNIVPGQYSVGVPSSATGAIVSEEVIPTNSSFIDIRDTGIASPYPSTISVSGVTGQISRVQVNLHGLSHSFPDDIDILLVGPTGARTLLMSDVGGGTGITNVTLTFDSTAGAFLPDQSVITSGTYRPTNFLDPDGFPTPAPGGPYTASFTPFLGTNPNGIWSLYVVDDTGQDTGSISGGWSVQIITALGVGIYDDTHVNWIYSGSWTRQSGQAGPYNHTFTHSSDLSATATIQINGTAFRLRYTRFTNRGNLAIFVDGVQVASQSATGSLSWQMVYERRGLSPGNHTIEIRHGGGGSFIDIDAIEIFASPLGTGIYDDRHPNWIYSGNWLPVNQDGPFNRTIVYANDLGARASILINGTAFRLRYTRFTNRGSLAIFVDGVQVASQNAAGSLAWQLVYERRGLSPGDHTIEIRHGGGGSFIDIDAIEVFSSPLRTGIYDDRHASWIYSGNWLAETLQGPYNRTTTYTGDLSARAAILINGTAFRLRYTRFTNRGSLAIFVDGVQVASQSAVGSLGWQMVFERRGLSPGDHTIEIRHGGGGSFIDIDAVEVFSSPLGTGIYDDRHASWVYSGNWLTESLEGPYNRTTTYTDDWSARASILINGTAFRLRYARFTNRGNLLIFVDGVQVATQSAAGSLAWQSVYERTGLSPGDHTIEIRHGGGGSFIDIDAIEVSGSTLLGTGIYDDRHASWIYSGNWLTESLQGPYNRTIIYTDDLSARASILINGTAFRLRYTRNTNRGSLAIFVDGVQVASQSAAGSLAWQSVYERTGLSPGIHLVEIRHGGWGSFIDIDAIEVFSSPLRTGIYDDRDASWVYSGNWLTESLDGPYNRTTTYTSDLSARASILIDGTGFRLRYTRFTNRGSLAIFVDGVLVASQSAAGTLNWQTDFTWSGLTDGVHTIEIRHNGLPGSFIDLDAIEVLSGGSRALVKSRLIDSGRQRPTSEQSLTQPSHYWTTVC